MDEPTLGCDVELRPTDPSGAVGEIVVRGIPRRQLLAGYLDDAASTRGAFAGDRFLTGDLVSLDADGRFRLAGRHGELLKVAGENVSMVEIETVLASHPAVLEAAVVGVPDPVRDEVPIAFVVETPGADVAEADLLAFADANLAAAKRPRDIRLVADLPRTSVGKVRKHDLVRAAQDDG
jgi:carnitine-CoA ligase